MRYTYLAILAVPALAAAAACAPSGDTATDDSDIEGSNERRAVGPARPYPPDTFGDEDERKFATSKKARRALGWRVLAKALAPVKIAQQDIAGLPAGEKTIPLFRTFLGPSEIELMFYKAYADLGKERRMARSAPSDAEWDALLDWNAKGSGSTDERDFFERLKIVTSAEDLQGLGGNSRAAYSPGYAKHLVQDYAALSECKDRVHALEIGTPPKSEANFTNCFSREMPTDAVAVKMTWKRTDAVASSGLSVVDTSAAAMAKRMTGETDEGGWVLSGMPTKAPSPTDAYTVRVEQDSASFALVGLHVLTKELRHWVWVSLWWSAAPDEDFGQDRPDEIEKLGPAWSNYKMCVVTDFQERDPDPTGGFTGSLGAALAAVHGDATWCSNPFIEKGAHNAETNCIGCHQHAGDTRSLPRVLTDATHFPLAGRTRTRIGFPADYSWAVAAPFARDTTGVSLRDESFLARITNRMQVYDREDRL